ncbi:MAG: exodeoxyribonuclease VII large subunit [Bacilli bacterium]|jgi:exodeoxyribonuclease VII large subunit
MNEQKYLTVSALNKYLAYKINNDKHLSELAVLGELSNVKTSKNHLYFVLKDDSSEINCIMFSSNKNTLKFFPIDGMKVIITGNVSVYEPRGTYNIIVSQMLEYGRGALYQAFLELKEKLQKEGLFDSKYKKIIPNYSENIGVITSETGEAFNDIKITISKRFPLAKIYLYPSLVQGTEAAKSLISSVKKANIDKLCDVIIIGRGGGSQEDLSCFNDEELARTIFNSKIPIVSGVGHEGDYTITDFVSDKRAATPTAAAMLITPEKDALLNLIQNKKYTINNYIKRKINDLEFKYSSLANNHYLKNYNLIIDDKIKDLTNLVNNLHKLSPINKINNSFDKLLNINNRLNILKLDQKIDLFLLNVDSKNIALHNSINKLIEYNSTKIDNIIERLIIINPLNLMKKGYTLVYQDNILIKSINNLNKHKDIEVKFVDGSVNAVIKNLERNKP